MGQALFSTLARDNTSSRRLHPEDSQYVEESWNTWFRTRKKGPHFARAVLVDTEDKVVNSVSQVQESSGSSWRYCRECRISSVGGGSGNNWAYGFHVKGPELHERVLECVRRQAEESDVPLAFLNLLSSSGGTGSGVGSYVVQELRHEFVFKKLVNVVVLPYSAGEVATQNYNTVLTLAKLYDMSDLHVVFQNDSLHRMCAALLGEKNTQLADMNHLMACKLASVFQPVQVYSGVSNIVSHLAAHPAFKMVTVKTAPHVSRVAEKFESILSWPVLLKHMKRSLRKVPSGSAEAVDWEIKQPLSKLPRSVVAQLVPSVTNMLFTRGCVPPDVETVSELSTRVPYCRWIPQEARLLHFHQPRRLLSHDKFITLVSNNNLVCHPLNAIVDKAWNTFAYKAYLHHYTKYGVQEDEFNEAFLKAERILQYYARMAKDSG
ncbi:hypothetical protein PR048_033683 [Dryococelus australis]|uniref:Tubulin delta chain n=1 Tax=Dryococelus australis TaxID=614101 RepID=A0ABQ9G526_9NEOP|nr:hypothetical protein PR048_033683 [Dryococelus australis]